MVFGKRRTTACEFAPVPVQVQVPVGWVPVTSKADLIAGDVATWFDGDSFIVSVVVAVTEDCRVVLQKGVYGQRRGADAFDLFMPRDGWRFVGGWREADRAL